VKRARSVLLDLQDLVDSKDRVVSKGHRVSVDLRVTRDRLEIEETMDHKDLWVLEGREESKVNEGREGREDQRDHKGYKDEKVKRDHRDYRGKRVHRLKIENSHSWFWSSLRPY
jgi:hypothetical protein